MNDRDYNLYVKSKVTGEHLLLGMGHCDHYLLATPVLGGDKQSSDCGFCLQTNAKMSQYMLFLAEIIGLENPKNINHSIRPP